MKSSNVLHRAFSRRPSRAVRVRGRRTAARRRTRCRGTRREGRAGQGRPSRRRGATPLPRAPSGKLFDTIRKRGTLLVGTSWSIPWSMRDPQGEWQGFEIDLARQLAADLGVDLTIVRVPFTEFTSALEGGRIDCRRRGLFDHAAARAGRRLQPSVRGLADGARQCARTWPRRT
jgi:ABC-type amino acid transport substrate-binding protein